MKINKNLINIKDKEKYQSLSTKVFALGGLEEIGKNTYCIEHNDEIIIIDAGVKFPDSSLLGINAIIPDYSYLIENSSKIKALLVTHGHEDHIGGIPYLLKQMDIPIIYAPTLAAALIRDRIEEMKQEMNLQTNVVIKVFNNMSQIKTKYFKINFFAVNHSIPDSYGISIETPNGRVVTTGDYKFDWTPLGHKADLKKMSEFENNTVLLMSDSTNSEIEGYTITETKIIKNIANIFLKATGRILISTFASNVHRLQQIIDAANKSNRKILIFGRALERITKIIRQLGHLKIADEKFIGADELNKYKNEEICIICTGSQGEPMAALSRIANKMHKFVSIIPGDTVIFSSSPIPGNRAEVELVVNKLSRLGAIVLENSPLNLLHTSGHASQEEQKLMLSLIKPKYFMPMHGDFRMLKIHGETAESVGIKKENIFIVANGDQINLYKKEFKVEVPGNNNSEPKIIKKQHYLAWVGERVDAEPVYVDGKDFSGQKNSVIKDRAILSKEGLIAVIISIDSQTNKLLTRPTIISRGSFYVKESGNLIPEATKLVSEKLEELFKSSKPKFKDIKVSIKNALGGYIYAKKKRNPLIIPVILNKK